MDKGRRPTRKDVAQRAGVSETIVSYVLNKNRCVNRDKARRVMEAVEELGYKPDFFARALKGKTTKHIMLLIDRIRTETFGELISKIENYSDRLGYLVSVSIIQNDIDYVRKIIDWHVDGVIISSVSFDSRYIKEFIACNIPVIVLENRSYEDIEGASTINTGLFEGARKCVRHLVGIGCSRIAYVDRVSSRNHFSGTDDFRYSGYVSMMDESGLIPYIISGCTSPEDLQLRIKNEMLSERFDGFFCRNDEIASIVMNSLMRFGYRIPEDVAVIGIDDTTFSRISFPTLTTMRIPQEKVAEAAVRIIDEYESGKACRIVFEPEFMIRESTARKKEKI